MTEILSMSNAASGTNYGIDCIIYPNDHNPPHFHLFDRKDKCCKCTILIPDEYPTKYNQLQSVDDRFRKLPTWYKRQVIKFMTNAIPKRNGIDSSINGWQYLWILWNKRLTIEGSIMENKELIQAASLSKLFKYISMYDCATISACRTYSAEPYYRYGANLDGATPEELKQFLVPPKVNKKNTAMLKQKIIALGYGVLDIKGVYEEQGSGKISTEISFFVFDISRKGKLRQTMLYLGNLFEQDSITYADAGGDFSLLSTTPFFEEPKRTKHKATGQVITRFKGVSYTTPDATNESQFYSRLKRKGFFWKNFTPKDFDIEIDSSVKNPYVEGSMKVGFRNGIIQSSPWTKETLASREYEIKEITGSTIGEGCNNVVDLNIQDSDLKYGTSYPIQYQR